MFERFTDRARRVLVLAQEEARLLNHSFIGTEHLLLGLIHEEEGVAAKALESFGVTLEAARREVEQTVGPAGSSLAGSPPFTPRSKRVLEMSLREALQLGHNYIGTEHLLLGLLRDGDGVGAQVLVSLGVDLSRVRHEVIQLLSGYVSVPPAAVGGDFVEATDIPVGAAALLPWDDASAVLLEGVTMADARTRRFAVDGVEYEMCTYRAGPPPEISLSVAGATVTAAAFNAYTRRLADAEEIEGLGDAATYSGAQGSLRVLAGALVFVIQVRNHPRPREAAISAARRALAHLVPPSA